MGDAQPVAARRAYFVLLVLIVTTFAAGINRQLLILIIEPLKLEMSLSDSDIGLLAGLAPGVIAGGGAIILGWLTDHMARHVLLGICIIIWCVAAASLGVAFTFLSFLLGVMMLALAQTAVGPVTNSLIPDVFTETRRVRANLIFYGASVIAAGLGAAVSGALLSWVQENAALLPAPLSQLPYWRSALVIVAVIGIPVALLVLMIGPVKRRAGSGEGQNAYDSLARYAKENGVAVFGLYAAIGLSTFAGMSVMAWAPSHIVRVFEATPGEVGFALGISVMVGGFAGVIIAALSITKLLRLYGPLAPRHLFQYAMLLTIFPGLLQLLSTSAMQSYVLYGVQIMFANLGFALSSTMIQDISPAKYRGRMFGISILLIAAISSSGPFVVGLISDQFVTDPKGLLWAMLLVVVPALILSALCVNLTNAKYRITVERLAIN